MLLPMSQTPSPSALSPSQWCAEIQAKMMAALDAAWAVIETSDDPAEIAKARDKARICGQMAAAVRKVAALSMPPKGATRPSGPIEDVLDAVERAATGKPPAAQAVAMRAALAKLKR